MQRIIVVGDVFNVPQSDTNFIMNESDAVEAILSLRSLSQDVELIVEQGVDMLALARAVEHRATMMSPDSPAYHLRPRQCMPRAVRRLAHKAKTENICVSFPRRTSEHEFEIDLHFSGQNEFFLDHMTGFHIQGMVLSEAARQAFLAVTEEFFLRDKTEKYYFVIKHQNISYENFVFPFGAKLNYRIREHKEKNGRYSFVVDIDLVQAGEVCCRVDIAFTVFEAEKISARERVLIEQRAEFILQSMDQLAMPPEKISHPMAEAV